MIRFLKRKDIATEKYDFRVENSLQSNVFAYSWYLDCVCDSWGAYVFEDYKAVMPIPIRKKYGIRYVYPPFWVLNLGIYSLENTDENEFLIEVFDDFKFVEYKVNSFNQFSMFKENQQEKTMQLLSLSADYETVLNKYRKDRKKDLAKAVKADLVEKWGDPPENLLNLFKQNVGKRIAKINTKDYDNLLKLMQACIKKRVGEVLSIYNKDNILVASGFFLKHQKKISILFSSTDFANRNNGANTFLIDRAIFNYFPHFDTFDFGGSSMKNIRDYFLSFGAAEEKCQFIKQNKLTGLFKFLKR